MRAMIIARVVFLAVVIFLPATMYYLFVTTRKVSLLNEFINNLDRLGFLNTKVAQWWYKEDDESMSMKRRLRFYRRKFEALYGPVTDESLRQAFIVAMPANSQPAGTVPAVDTGVSFSSEKKLAVITTTILIALGWFLILPPLEPLYGTIHWENILTPRSVPVYFAFAGAYFFLLQMLFRRYVLRDLRSSAYVASSIRIILAVIGVWVISILTEPNKAPKALALSTHTLVWLGFVVGVFPTVVWQFLQSALKKVTFAEVVIPSLKAQLPLSDLDGLTVWHESRLEIEDVENIPNMATADLVDLMLQTRFSPDRIIDWVDQAILYTHIGLEGKKSAESDRARLRQHGIRTATSLVQAFHQAQVIGQAAKFESILEGEGRIRDLCTTVQTNPNFHTVWKWRQLPQEGMSVTPMTIRQKITV